jgi:hypothetical protein
MPLRDFLTTRRLPAPTAPSPTPPPPDLAAEQQKAAAALYARLGSPAPVDDTVQIPVPPKTRSLYQARLLARAFGTHAEMRALGIPEEEIASYLDPSDPTPPKKAPATPPTDIHFGPTPTPAAPTPPPELPARFVQPGVRPVLGQIVHAFTPYPGACTNMSVAETYTGFRNLGVTSSDSPDPVVRLENAAAGPDRISAKTVYRYDPAPVPQGEATPVTPTPPTWHRAGPGCPFGR